MVLVSPSMAIVPEVGFSTPAMMLKSVLLPQPLGPITETNSPVATTRSIDASASRRCRPVRKVFEMPCTTNLGESMLYSLIEHAKGRDPDEGGLRPESLKYLLAHCATSLRWYYPDQVHRVGNPPNAATSQPNGSPSSEMMLLCR